MIDIRIFRFDAYTNVDEKCTKVGRALINLNNICYITPIMPSVNSDYQTDLRQIFGTDIPDGLIPVTAYSHQEGRYFLVPQLTYDLMMQGDEHGYPT